MASYTEFLRFQTDSNLFFIPIPKDNHRKNFRASLKCGPLWGGEFCDSEAVDIRYGPFNFLRLPMELRLIIIKLAGFSDKESWLYNDSEKVKEIQNTGGTKRKHSHETTDEEEERQDERRKKRKCDHEVAAKEDLLLLEKNHRE